MQANPQRIKLDMTSKATATAQVVRVMRYDSKSRPVSASIYDDGAFRDDLNVNNARLYIESLSDAPPTYVENIAIVSGIADFTIPQSATLTAGIMRAELRVIDSASGQVITSMPFVIECIQSVYSDDAVMGTDNGDVLVNTVAKATASAKKAALSAAAANLSDQNSRENAESASVSAQAAAASAAQAISAVDSNAVKFSAEQNLTFAQQAQARNNIDAVSSKKANDIADFEIRLQAVMYTQNQLLSSEQQAQARFNIGAVDASKVKSSLSANDDIPNAAALVKHLGENVVQFSIEQSLTDAQKALARKNIGAVSSSDVSSAIDAATQYVVSAGEQQNFTDEQKTQARFNIGAVDASKVKSSLSAHDDIPNARAMADYVDDTVKHTAVMISEQSLSDEQKSTARENIGALAVDNVVLKSTDKPDTDASKLIYSIAGVQNLLYRNVVLSTIDQSASEVANWTDAKKAQARKNMDVDGGKWVLLRTYTTDGVNKSFGDGTTSNVATTTTDGDGNALSLSAVSVVFKNTAAAAANSYAALFAYTASGENEYGGYSVSTNAINTKENAQGVMTVFADRGYYRSLSIDGALKNSAYARENPSQAFVMTSDSVINQIKFVLGAIPPADDIIEIWGIKA